MKTVKVRIAVAVDRNGEWSACGWRDCKDAMAMSSAVELLDEGEARYWLTAEVPLPGEIDVTASLEKDTSER